jgi:CDP-paratose 2-epimerase
MRSQSNNGTRPVLITGGAGFIGANLAHRLLAEGRPVVIFDNLSRAGVENNLAWLLDNHGGLLEIETGDVRNPDALRKVVGGASQVFHLAAQVAVTTSLVQPTFDFDVNARGTLNLLEALRSLDNPPPLVFTSTNKVYGALDDVKLTRESSRYLPEAGGLRASGIDESRCVDFHSPYGCSKGAADQYVLDYARTFRLPAVVFRMSCIYGPHQFGTEDQGWVAHFLIRAVGGEPVTLYGDGLQVRDLLFVDDLIDAFRLAQERMGLVGGHAFNIGGGPANAVSLLELINLIGELRGEDCPVEYSDWRHADQRYYVSDTRRFQAATGWRPGVGVREGVGRLYRWLLESRGHKEAARADGRSGAQSLKAASFEVATTRG